MAAAHVQYPLVAVLPNKGAMAVLSPTLTEWLNKGLVAVSSPRIRRKRRTSRWVRDCDWSVDEVYSYREIAIGRWVRYIPIEGLRLVPLLQPVHSLFDARYMGTPQQSLQVVGRTNMELFFNSQCAPTYYRGHALSITPLSDIKRTNME
eukprot:234126-Prorocentrum_minimum.AAC.1